MAGVLFLRIIFVCFHQAKPEIPPKSSRHFHKVSVFSLAVLLHSVNSFLEIYILLFLGFQQIEFLQDGIVNHNIICSHKHIKVVGKFLFFSIDKISSIFHSYLKKGLNIIVLSISSVLKIFIFF